MKEVFAVIGIAAIGWWFGWVAAHKMVAAECERTGSFFVGKVVFHCTSVNREEEDAAE